MTGHRASGESWGDQAAFRDYVASRLGDLAFAFSDHGILAESIDASSVESRAFRGFIAMNLDALVHALDAADELNRLPRVNAHPHRPT